VTALVRPEGNSPSGKSRLAALRGGSIQFAELDLAGVFDSGCLPTKCDVVIHAAQSRHYREFPAAAEEIFQINTAVPQRLAAYALGAGARQFIYFSTGSVYAPNEKAVAEKGPVAPGSFYAASKLAAETLLAPYAAHLTLLVLRPFYMYGPGQREMLVSRLAHAICRGQPVELKGPDGARLTPTFADDVARVCAQAIAEGWNGTLNVANPVAVSLRRLAEEIGREKGRVPAFSCVADTPPLSLVPDVSKLGERFELDSMVDLREGLRRTFAVTSNQERALAERHV
jgi:nucleoside-diphosphate-sugar epimerase